MCQFTVFGFAKNMKNMWIGLLFLLPAMERRAATSAMANDHAVASGTAAVSFVLNVGVLSSSPLHCLKQVPHCAFALQVWGAVSFRQRSPTSGR